MTKVLYNDGPVRRRSNTTKVWYEECLIGRRFDVKKVGYNEWLVQWKSGRQRSGTIKVQYDEGPIWRRSCKTKVWYDHGLIQSRSSKTKVWQRCDSGLVRWRSATMKGCHWWRCEDMLNNLNKSLCWVSVSFLDLSVCLQVSSESICLSSLWESLLTSCICELDILSLQMMLFIHSSGISVSPHTQLLRLQPWKFPVMGGLLLLWLLLCKSWTWVSGFPVWLLSERLSSTFARTNRVLWLQSLKEL